MSFNVNNWVDVVLSDVLLPKGYIRGPFGSALRRNELLPFGIPVYEQQHAISEIRDFRFFINEEKFQSMKRFAIQTDDLIISCSGTLGKVSIIRESDPFGIISQALLLLRVDNKKILPKYLKYFFITNEGYNAIVSRSSGSVQVNISKRADIEQIPIKLPPLIIQAKIVDIISALDNKIEINTRMNKVLEETARALFHRWFVEFEFPDEKGRPYKSSGGKMAESEMGSVPEGWSVGTLGDIFSIKSGKRPLNKESDKTKESKIPILGASGVMGFTSEILYNEPILVTGRVGTHGIIQRSKKSCWPSDNTLVISSRWYEYAYQNLLLINFKNMNRGSTQPLITQKDLKSIHIILPPELLLNNFELMISKYFDIVDMNIDQCFVLPKIRDSLLPKLINGEIEV